MKVKTLIEETEKSLASFFQKIDEVSLFNEEKVLKAMQEEQIALRHFAPSTGYGYEDIGRGALGRVYAKSFGAESAIVSPALLSGTHTICVGLFGILRPGDCVLSITGEPYDTLQGVIHGEGNGSLKDFHICFESVPLTKEGKVDFEKIEKALRLKHYNMVYIQRSRGYGLRDAFAIKEIEKMCSFVRGIGFDGCIYVDNCYGEFVETKEPTEVGADVIAGSLIKNPGGGIAPTGGYLAGKANYIKQIENRLTAPSVGNEVGSYAYGYRDYFQGFFLAPHVVAQSLKGGLLLGRCLEKLGFVSYPKTDALPADITRAVRFDTEKQLTDFICSVQECSPVDGFVTPVAWDMPGYDSRVIMAAGTFVQGASIELSADAPIREPYTAYFQGGLTYEHCKIACRHILEKLI